MASKDSDNSKRFPRPISRRKFIKGMGGGVVSSAALGTGILVSDPSEAEIRKGVSGNTCRCGTYPNVFKAAKAAAGDMRRGA